MPPLRVKTCSAETQEPEPKGKKGGAAAKGAAGAKKAKGVGGGSTKK